MCLLKEDFSGWRDWLPLGRVTSEFCTRAVSSMQSAFQPGQDPGGISGLRSARSFYLAVSSSPRTWH